jgi:hypothetical protein
MTPMTRIHLMLHQPVHPLTGEPLLDSSGDPLPAPVFRTQARDGGVRLEYLLTSLARSGRRRSDFLGEPRGGVGFYLGIRDLALTPDEVEAELAVAPSHRVRWARHFARYGALVANRNKTNTHRVLPFSKYWREATDKWLSHHPEPDNPNAPLLPSMTDPREPLRYATIYGWLLRMENEARSDLSRMGLDADEIRHRAGSALHGIRPAWWRMMTQLGWGVGADDVDGKKLKVPSLNKHALFYGGWTLGTSDERQCVSWGLVPEFIVAVAEFIPAREALRAYPERIAEEMRFTRDRARERRSLLRRQGRSGLPS